MRIRQRVLEVIIAELHVPIDPIHIANAKGRHDLALFSGGLSPLLLGQWPWQWLELGQR